MKLRIFAATVVLAALALVGGIIWRQHVIHSPEYSLERLATAIERHDVATFQQLVDVDTVVNRFFDASMSAATGDSADSDLATMIGQGMAALLKPRLTAEAKAAILAAVEKGLPTDSSSGIIVGSYVKRGGLTAENFRRLTTVSRDGAAAVMGLEFANARIDSVVTLELRMRDMGDYWQVSEVANSAEFDANLTAAEERRLERYNRPIRARLAAALVVDDLHKSARDVDSFFGGEVALRASIRNASDTTIAGFSAELRLADADGHHLINLPVSSADTLAPRATYDFTWKQGLGLFAGAEKRLVARTPPGRIRPELTCKRLLMPDGTVVQVFTSLDDALAAQVPAPATRP